VKLSLASCAVLAFAGAVSVHASTIAYLDPANQGTQAFGGNLALNFNVLSPVTVTALGVFNALGTGTITNAIQVVIYNSTGTQVTPVVTFQGNFTPAGDGFDVFQNIAPVVLGVGSYQVDAVGFGAADLNGNLNTGSSSGPALNNDGGNLAFTGAAYDGAVVLDHPTTCSGCQAAPAPQNQQFDAGTFEVDSSTGIPEPSYGPLMLAGLGGVGLSALLRRIRRRRMGGEPGPGILRSFLAMSSDYLANLGHERLGEDRFGECGDGTQEFRCPQ